MNRNKLPLFISILIVLIAAFVYGMLYWCDNWTFLKCNDNLYVLNIPLPLEQSEINNLTKVGRVEKEIPRLFIPEYNNVSNGLPEGTDIYINNRTFYKTLNIVIKFKDKFYELSNTATAEGWGNGIIVKLH